jgi:hypothetical protein
VGTFGPDVVGLVPDGVTTVVLRFADGQVRRASIHDNFFWVTDAPSRTRLVRGAPMRSTAPFSARAQR